MKKFGFISRHQPTAEQLALAGEKGIKLVPLGDMDAFTEFPGEPFLDGYCIAHPAMAIRILSAGYAVGVFENGQRTAIGGTQTFKAIRLHIFDVVWDRHSAFCFRHDGAVINTYI